MVNFNKELVASAVLGISAITYNPSSCYAGAPNQTSLTNRMEEYSVTLHKKTKISTVTYNETSQDALTGHLRKDGVPLEDIIEIKQVARTDAPININYLTTDIANDIRHESTKGGIVMPRFLADGSNNACTVFYYPSTGDYEVLTLWVGDAPVKANGGNCAKDISEFAAESALIKNLQVPDVSHVVDALTEGVISSVTNCVASTTNYTTITTKAKKDLEESLSKMERDLPQKEAFTAAEHRLDELSKDAQFGANALLANSFSATLRSTVENAKDGSSQFDTERRIALSTIVGMSQQEFNNVYCFNENMSKPHTATKAGPTFSDLKSYGYANAFKDGIEMAQTFSSKEFQDKLKDPAFAPMTDIQGQWKGPAIIPEGTKSGYSMLDAAKDGSLRQAVLLDTATAYFGDASDASIDRFVSDCKAALSVDKFAAKATQNIGSVLNGDAAPLGVPMEIVFGAQSRAYERFEADLDKLARGIKQAPAKQKFSFIYANTEPLETCLNHDWGKITPNLRELKYSIGQTLVSRAAEKLVKVYSGPAHGKKDKPNATSYEKYIAAAKEKAASILAEKLYENALNSRGRQNSNPQPTAPQPGPAPHASNLPPGNMPKSAARDHGSRDEAGMMGSHNPAPHESPRVGSSPSPSPSAPHDHSPAPQKESGYHSERAPPMHLTANMEINGGKSANLPGPSEHSPSPPAQASNPPRAIGGGRSEEGHSGGASGGHFHVDVGKPQIDK